ncbi:MAG: hypothetical protein RX316_09790, partial [bacterium]|nr:hypothetical protein [bacterium]
LGCGAEANTLVLGFEQAFQRVEGGGDHGAEPVEAGLVVGPAGMVELGPEVRLLEPVVDRGAGDTGTAGRLGDRGASSRWTMAWDCWSAKASLVMVSSKAGARVGRALTYYQA